MAGVFRYKEHKPTNSMKTSLCLAACLCAMMLTPVFGQPANQPPPLTKFNLDFPGGTPAQLVKAIQKATGKPLNVIIPDEDANIGLPPLKMDNVDVAQLFQTLGAASKKVENRNTSVLFNGPYYGSPSYSYATVTTGYGFKTDGNLSDNSIWYFYVDNPPQAPSLPPPPPPAKSCRFYQLAPYLDRGLTVDDITTAIQTGWKMMGDAETPEISFHKETKLLIAVGEPDQLGVIDDVLRALQPPPPNPTTENFQKRLQQIIKAEQQSSAAAAHAPLSPEDQMKLMEQNRQNGSQLPAAGLPPPSSQPRRSPANPEAGQ